MTSLRCEATRWALDDDDDFYPGWVKVRLTDARGREWVFFDKPPIFGGGDALSPKASYPVAVTIDCAILRRTSGPGGADVVTVSTGGRPVAEEGDRSEFDVRLDQLMES
ncbi:hypothetical protein [Streptomyces sp. NPDC005244]|uniref:hypothetical protein n=1 Tax=Streptomyces sp. NPDC005244 TaxID=3364708 RepID=UPI0036BFE695